MSPQDSLLKTKFQRPDIVDDALDRQHLLKQLDRVHNYPLTLVSAPPGYGKTVLASSWAKSQKNSVAWLNLDTAEAALERFMAYLLAALESVHSGCFHSCQNALAVVCESNEVGQLGQLLIDAILSVPDKVLLVLDDYQRLAHHSRVHELLDLLLKHPPSNLHLLVITRHDPPFSLVELRAKSKVLEIRQADLRLTLGESSALLDRSMLRRLSDHAKSEVMESMEGWIAGIRMISHVADRPVSEIAPCNVRSVKEYMAKEVFDSLDQNIAGLVVCSSLFKRFNAEMLDCLVSELPDICNGVSGIETLSQLVSDNIFISSLDDYGEWYNYHSIFRDLLLGRLTVAFGRQQIEALCLSISDWLVTAGYVDDAIELLLERKLYGKAAVVIESHRDKVLDEDRWQTLEEWLSRFPFSEMSTAPNLLIAKGALAAFKLDIYLLDDVARQLEACHERSPLSAVHYGEYCFIKGLVLFWTGDIAGARELLELAFRTPMEHGQMLGEVCVYVSMARTMTGNSELALSELDRLEEQNNGIRNVFLSRVIAVKSFVNYVLVKPAAALVYADRLAAIAEVDVPSDHVKGWAKYMRAMVLFNTGRLTSGLESAKQALRYAESIETRLVMELHAMIGMCGSLLGRPNELRDTIEKLNSLAADPSQTDEVVDFSRSIRARILLLDGDQAAAIAAAPELIREPSAGTLAFFLEESSVTWAKIQLVDAAEEAARGAMPLLTLLYEQATEQHLRPSCIELGLLKAIAYHRLGDLSLARSYGENAIDMAMADNWVGPFLELHNLLETTVFECLTQIRHLDFLHQIRQRRPKSETIEPDSEGPDCEVFSSRELEILELLSRRFQNKQIATELFISSNTVNYHLKQIYRKLDVNSRRGAVMRAGQLGLVSGA